MHYVIGDVHGCLDEMLLLIGKIESKDPDAEFIFVGDFIDRGEQVWETYLWVKENITENGKFRSVRGNHEQMAIDWMKDYMVWLQGKNIFGEPPYYFDFDRALYANRNPEIIRKENFCPEDFKEIMECFEALPFDIRVPVTTKWGEEITYRIVHAGYAYGEENQRLQHEINIWDRTQTGNYNSPEIVVHGHTPTIDIDYIYWDQADTNPGMISYRRNMINIDGGCVFHKVFPKYPCMLCSLCLETLEEIYPWELEERYLYYCGDEDKDLAKAFAEKYRREYLSRSLRERERILRRMGRPEEENR
ncbi:MAG: serine/threonine protein phosphatase [Lachnospiraceae bacterium]|nr:serine/threonine protein phosphatase [Lachnospiraceae bacterium]